MFYLKNFFLLCFKYPVRGFMYLLVTLLMTIVFMQGESIKKNFWSYYGKKPFYPSFYVMFNSKEDNDYIKNKILKLPGIHKIEMKQKSELASTIGKNFDEMGIPKDFANFDFSILKIYLNENVKMKTKTLLKEYIKRLVKDEEIIFSPFYDKEINRKIYKNDFMIFLKEWGDFASLLLVMLLWLISFFFMFPVMKKMAFLTESFQRRKMVFLKTFSIGNGFIILMAFLITIPFNTPWPVGTFLMFAFLLLIVTIVMQGGHEYIEKN